MSIPICNPQTYGWIKPALAASMQRVMDSVSKASKAENDADFLQFVEITPELHQIQSSLKMVELDAASRLVDNLEALCAKLATAQPPTQQLEPLGAIQKALVALDNYLRGIENETPISPLALLEGINGVRNFIPKPSLSEYDLFQPPMNLSATTSTESKPIPAKTREKLVSNLRKRYRKALMSWMSGGDGETQLKAMSDILANLQQLSNLDVAQQLWWVAGGFIDAIASGKLPDDADIKAQCAKLDLEIERMREADLATIVSSPPDELVRKMLYYIGANPSADSERIGQIREQADLQSWFQVEVAVETESPFQALRARIAKYASTLDSRQLAHIEESLDKYFSAQIDSQGITRLQASMDQLANSSAQAELEAFGDLIGALRDAVKTVDNSEAILRKTSADIKIATTMLLVQDTLKDQTLVGNDWLATVNSRLQELKQLAGQSTQAESGVQQIAAQSQAEYQNTRTIVGDSLKKALIEVETTFADMQSAPLDADTIVSVISNLDEIASLLLILEQAGAATLSKSLSQVFEQIRLQQLHPSPADHERMAFVVASLSVSIEQLGNYAAESTELLNNATLMLESIGQDPEPQEEPAAVDAATGQASDTPSQPAAPIDDIPVTNPLDDLKLREIFTDELQQQITQLSDSWQILASRQAGLAAHREQFLRVLHTLVGNCRSLYLDEMASCAKDLQDLVLDPGTAAAAQLFEQAINLFQQALAQIRVRGGYDDALAAQFTQLSPTASDTAPRAEGRTNTVPTAPAAKAATVPRVEKVADVPAAVEASPAQPAAVDVSPAQPAAVEASPVQPAAVDVSPAQPAAVEASPVQPAAVEVSPAQPAAVEASPVQPAAVEASPVQPAAVDVSPAQPAAVEASPAQPAAVDSEIGSAADDDEQDEIDPEIQEIFLAEAKEVLDSINGSLSQWRESGLDEETLAQIRRGFHTLKGSAATTGYKLISSLSHSVESLLDARDPATATDSPGLLNLMEEMHDGLAANLGFIPNSQQNHIQSLQKMVLVLLQGDTASDTASDVASDTKDAAADAVVPEQVAATDAAAPQDAAASSSELARQDEMDKLDLAQAESSQVETKTEDETPAEQPPALTREQIEDAEWLELQREMEKLVLKPAQPVAESLAKADAPKTDAAEPASKQPPDLTREQPLSVARRDPAQADSPSVAPQPGLSLSDGELDIQSELEKMEREQLQTEPEESPAAKLPEPPAKPAVEPIPKPAAEVAPKPVASQAAAQAPWRPPQGIASSDSAAEQAAPAATGYLRIDNQKLADLINTSGEIGLVRAQLQDTLNSTRADLETLRTNMKLVQDGLRELELEADAQTHALPEREAAAADDNFDPLQLDRYSTLQAKSRELSAKMDTLVGVERNLEQHAAEFGRALAQQTYLGEQMQDGLISARMVAISDYLPRLRLITRESARSVGRQVEFVLSGGDIEVDRQVIDSMIASFEHIIRNSITHGLESEAERQAQNKPASAKLRLDVVQQGTELVLEYTDDGRGLDTEKLAKQAVALGIVKAPSQATDEDFLHVITQRGFSTSEEVSMEAGRGVGMDVVMQAVKDLSGSMALTTRRGHGVKFQFRLPVTLAINQALVVRVGEAQYVIHTRVIERVVRVANNEILDINNQRYFKQQNLQLPVVSLADKLQQSSLRDDPSIIPLVVVRLADRTCAFEVDDFGGARDIVSKTPGSQLTSIRGVAGVTILADSSIVLILDPNGLIDEHLMPIKIEQVQPPSEVAESAVEPPAAPVVPPSLRRVLVVDDSLVVRKVMQRDLQGLGLQVVAAIDGLDALEQLSTESVDIALVDIEMPRMNGYELLVKLREHSTYSNLPAIMITSRAGEQHRQRALELGANEYVTKPYALQALRQMMQDVLIKQATRG